ncbi:MAG: hypothetical protein GX034_01140 [Clostridiaceae bacterium]|nr:hypothetical protein [Clostridiaceae bacterium]
MRFLSGHLPERLHKRTLVVLFSVILSVSILASAVLLAARSYIAPENSTAFSIAADNSGRYVSGLGVNLLRLPSANLIHNGAFEQPLVQTQFIVNGGSENKFSVTTSESIGNLPLTDDYFKGADINIFRSSNDGMKKLHSAKITGYEVGRLLNQTSLDLPGSLTDIHWFDFAESDTIVERVVVAGSAGTLLSLGKPGEVKIIKSGHDDDFTSVAFGNDGFLAVDSGGRFYVSDDGLEFIELNFHGRGSLHDVAYRSDPGGDSGFYLVAGESGQLYLGRGREFEQLKLGLSENLNALVVPEEGIMYALGDNGSALYSHNGIDWLQDESLAVANDWLSGDAADDVMFLAGSNGLMAVKRGDEDFEILKPTLLAAVLGIGQDFNLSLEDSRDIIWPSFHEVSLFSSEHIVIISEFGNAYQSLNQARDWQRVDSTGSSSAAITKMERLPSGRVFIAKQDGSIDWASFSSVFTFAPAFSSSAVLAGDYVTVDLSATIALNTAQLPELYPEAEVKEGEWLISGNTAAAILPLSSSGYVEDTDEVLPVNGPRGSVLRLEGAKNETDLAYQEKDARLDPQKLFSLQRKVLISEQFQNPMRPYLDQRLVQKIDSDNLITAVKPSVFPLKFDICLEGPIQGPLEVWLSGPDFEVAEEIELNQGWQHINTLLLLPRPLKAGDQVYLNIGFAGDAVIYLDNIFLGRADESAKDMSVLARNIASEAPDIPVLRLDCVPIGKAGYKSYSWALPEGETGYLAPQSKNSERHNLGAVLQLSEAVNASPWLVIDARAGEEEIQNLLEYLAGSPLSGYGKARANDGVIGRWTDAFDLVYIELVDSADTLPSDRLKAQRVDWVVEQCQNSTLYQEISNKLVFIDGMDYEEGGLRTNVDYHASILYSNQTLSGSQDLDIFIKDWQQSLPRRTIMGSSFRPELISSLRSESVIGTDVRLADLAALSLSGLESETELVLLDVDMLDPSYYARDNPRIALLKLADSLRNASVLDRARQELSHDEQESKDPLTGNKQGVSDLSETENHSLRLFSFKQNESYLLVAVNLGENAGQFTLRNLPQIEAIASSSFDSQGRLIGENMKKRSNSSFSVMPGGLVVLKIEISE